MKNMNIQITGIKCDNSDCDYYNDTVTVDNYPEWLNKSCPNCGANLLTDADFKIVQNLLKIEKAVNQLIKLDMDGTGSLKITPIKDF